MKGVPSRRNSGSWTEDELFTGFAVGIFGVASGAGSDDGRMVIH